MAKKLWSIFTDRTDRCIVTGMTVNVHRHHIFEGLQGFKKKSEEFGFIVPLHESIHHGPHMRFDNNWVDLQHWLQRKCQEFFIEVAHYGSREDWYSIFGKFYDDRSDEQTWLNGNFEWDLTDEILNRQDNYKSK